MQLVKKKAFNKQIDLLKDANEQVRLFVQAVSTKHNDAFTSEEKDGFKTVLQHLDNLNYILDSTKQK